MLSYHITLRELFPIVLALEIWGEYLHNKCVTFYCNNKAVVYIINKQTSKDPSIMKLVRRFVVLILKYKFLFQTLHIEGVQNMAADQLSRLQIIQLKNTWTNILQW
jgi:hypothetical protein